MLLAKQRSGGSHKGRNRDGSTIRESSMRNTCALTIEMFCKFVADEHLCTDVFGLDPGLRRK